MQTVQEVQEVKTQPMRYVKKSIEDEEKEIEELEAERNKTEEDEKVKANEDENLNAEEKTFKKRYGDLRRHVQSIQTTHETEIRKLQSQVEGLTKKQVKQAF